VVKRNAGQRHIGVQRTGDFEAALREEGGLGLLITGRGQFRARLRAPPNVRDIKGETLG
jgi:hypothetical protein